MYRFLLLFAVALAVLSAARAEPFDAGHAEVELISERTTAIPGETVYLALDKTLDDGWHVYWRNPGDVGLPPAVDQWLTGEAMAGDFIWPIPHELPVVPGKIMDYGFK